MDKKLTDNFCDEMWLHIYKMFAQYQTKRVRRILFNKLGKKKTTHQGAYQL